MTNKKTHAIPVIGKEMAQALRAEEEAQVARKPGSGHLPKDLHYDPWQGDFNLFEIIPRPLDNILSKLSLRFAQLSPEARSEFRKVTSLDDFYTLLNFARRSAVFALRDRNSGHLVAGLTAVAAIESDRIDYRDALSAMSLLNHSSEKIGARTDELFSRAASLAEPKISASMLGFRKKSDDYRDLKKSWGYCEVETKLGLGFVRSEFSSYHPKLPLDQIALELARIVQQDEYGSADVILASKIPEIWLSPSDKNSVKIALANLCGVVVIRTDLRPRSLQDHQHDFLLIFLAEADTEAEAMNLLTLTGESSKQPNVFVRFGIQEGRLYCLIIEKSAYLGEIPFETQTSLQRFISPITTVLSRYVEHPK